jgi:transcriptional regulator with XRE-family HTH domain
MGTQCPHVVIHGAGLETRCPHVSVGHGSVAVAMLLVDSFSNVLRDVRSATKWTQRALAFSLGVSPKTLGRYESGAAMPPVSRRHGIVHALRGINPALLFRVARSLDVADDFVEGLPHPPRVVDAGVVRGVVERAVIEAAERVDAGPGRTRTAIQTFLARLAEAGIDRDEAHRVLAGAERRAGG